MRFCFEKICLSGGKEQMLHKLMEIILASELFLNKCMV